jgi:RNA polymerase sigma factor (sigma-70 family)
MVLKRQSRVLVSRCIPGKAGMNLDLEARMLDCGYSNPRQLFEALKPHVEGIFLKDVELFCDGVAAARAVDGSWHPIPLAISDLLDCLPDTIFSFEHQWHPKDSSDASEDSIGWHEGLRRVASSQGDTLEEFVVRQDVGRAVSSVLLTLTPREERIVRLRFGFGVPAMTLDEIAQAFSVSPLRVRKIEGRALRKMKHSSRAEPLQIASDGAYGGGRGAGGETFVRDYVFGVGGLFDGKIDWPDLSHYGIEMKLAMIPGSKHVLIIRSDRRVFHDCDRQLRGPEYRPYLEREALSQLGFEPRRDGSWVNREATFSFPEFRKHLSRTMWSEASLKSIAIDCNPPECVAREDRQDTAASMVI